MELNQPSKVNLMFYATDSYGSIVKLGLNRERRNEDNEAFYVAGLYYKCHLLLSVAILVFIPDSSLTIAELQDIWGKCVWFVSGLHDC